MDLYVLQGQSSDIHIRRYICIYIVWNEPPKHVPSDRIDAHFTLFGLGAAERVDAIIDSFP